MSGYTFRKASDVNEPTPIRSIALTKGLEAIVDAADFEWLSRYKWLATGNAKQTSFYAGRTVQIARGVHRYKTVLMHREIIGALPGQLVDHIDQNPLNNCRANLRIVTRSQNAMNARPHRHSSSRFKGVSWAKNAGAWDACIRADGRKLHLGYFACEIEAAKAYDAAALQHFGPYASINFPGGLAA